MPADVPLLILVGELHGLLGSPDPELRDDIAYSVLANWIYRQRVVPEEERLRLLRAWEGDLKAGVGERGTHTVVRSRHLQPAEQSLILSAIEAKLRAVDVPLVHGEDERVARAVVSITSRPDFDDAAFAAWLKTMLPMRRATPPTPATLATDQNRKNLLVSLFTVLSTDRRDLAGNTRVRALVLETLKGVM